MINTPGQAYTWRYSIDYFKNNGYNVGILARQTGPTLRVLDSFGFQYTSFKPINRKLIRPLEMFVHLQKGIGVSSKLHPSIIIGFGVDSSLLAKLLNVNSIVFTDVEATHIQNTLVKLVSNVIVTPDCFRVDLGPKHLRVKGYKELAYLHPNHFTPDPGIFDELKLTRGEKYVILRFNAFKAVHDIGKHGFSKEDKISAVRALERYAKVFVSAEGSLPEGLEGYILPISPNRIHHALYYAQMILADTGTMTVESAVLGTPGIMCNSFVELFGNYTELENKYGMLFLFHDPKQVIDKGLELAQLPDLKEQWAKKRQRMLADKIDVTSFMINLIENYLENNHKNIETLR
jgi:uncharacterized protein